MFVRAVSGDDLHPALHAAQGHGVARTNRQGRAGARTVDGAAADKRRHPGRLQSQYSRAGDPPPLSRRDSSHHL